jgi:hypothetical protein
MAVVRHKEAIHSGHFMMSEFEDEDQVEFLRSHKNGFAAADGWRFSGRGRGGRGACRRRGRREAAPGGPADLLDRRGGLGAPADDAAASRGRHQEAAQRGAAEEAVPRHVDHL